MVLSQSLFLAGCWLKASVPHRVGLSIGLLTTTACFSPKAERGMGEGVGRGKGEGRESGWKLKSLYNPIWEVVHS